MVTKIKNLETIIAEFKKNKRQGETLSEYIDRTEPKLTSEQSLALISKMFKDAEDEKIEGGFKREPMTEERKEELLAMWERFQKTGDFK